MSTTNSRDILAELEQIPELLPLPDTALKLLNASKNPDVGARELCQIVSCDTSLSIRLLQISNSTLYGMSGQIKTVEHAAVVLGVRGLRDLAMSIIALGVFEDSADSNRSVSSLWKHSLGCATVARVIAQQVDSVCPDEAFVSGIVHDVGKLVLVQLLNDQYDLIPRALEGRETVTEEVELYGVCHAELGQRCAEEWGLPYEISDALRNHHSTDTAGSHCSLTAVVCAANQLSKIWQIGNEVEVEAELDALEVSESANLPLDELELTQMREQCAVEYTEVQQAFKG